MGFNIRVNSDIADDSECQSFLDREYYVFVTTLENFADNSVLELLGEEIELDIRLLGLFYYNSLNPPRKYWIEIDQITELVENLIERLNANPLIAEKLDIPYPQNEDFFREYISQGQLLDHLYLILKSIKCNKSKGATKIFFSAN